MCKCDGLMQHLQSAWPGWFSMSTMLSITQPCVKPTPVTQLDAQIIYMYQHVCVQPADVYVTQRHTCTALDGHLHVCVYSSSASIFMLQSNSPSSSIFMLQSQFFFFMLQSNEDWVQDFNCSSSSSTFMLQSTSSSCCRLRSSSSCCRALRTGFRTTIVLHLHHFSCCRDLLLHAAEN